MALFFPGTAAPGVAGVARVRRGLDEAERGRAVGTDAAELAIEIGLPSGDHIRAEAIAGYL
jgi:hypothetical protein